MNKLSTDELLYLLYTFANSREQETVLQSTVREALSRDKKKLGKKQTEIDIELAKKALLEKKMVEIPKDKKRHLFVTDIGCEALVSNLAITDFKFKSQKGEKVLNALLYCIKSIDSGNSSSAVLSYGTFWEKFRNLYFKERQDQELSGVVAIRRKDISRKFIGEYPIAEELFNTYFNKLISDRKIFINAGKEDDLVHIAE